jgi:hypothetical protein
MCGTCVESTTTIKPSTSPQPSNPNNTVDTGSCSFRGRFETAFGSGTRQRFSSMLNPVDQLSSTVPHQRADNTTFADYAATCVCACQFDAQCIAAAVRTTSNIYVCYLMSGLGHQMRTALEVVSYQRADAEKNPTCGAEVADTSSTVQQAISLLRSYKSPVINRAWDIDAAAIIEQYRLPSATTQELFDAKVSCLHKCCGYPLCNAAYIASDGNAASCTLLGKAGVVPLNNAASSMRLPQGSETLMYGRSG